MYNKTVVVNLSRCLCMKVLIVEDEKLIASPMAQILRKNNYMTVLASDGQTGLEHGLTGNYDLIILDIMLPKLNGIEVLKELRNQGITTPVLMLTARGKVEDKVMGLDNGADDYLPKPFDYDELLARMRSLLRRGESLQESHIFKIGNIELNVNTSTLSTDIGSCQLTKKEMFLLELLIKRGKNATPKAMIIDKIWPYDSNATHAHVDYHVSRLRKKLKLVHGSISVKMIYGVGYLLIEN